MKTRNIYKTPSITPQCCMIGSKIFYVQSKSLFEYDFNLSYKSLVCNNFDCHFLQSTKTDLITIFNDKITLLNTKGEILQSFYANFVPFNIKKINTVIYILGNNNLIVFNKNIFEEIKIVKCNNFSILDFCKLENSFLFLTKENKIYESEDFTKTGRILPNKEIIFFEETNEKIIKIGYFENKIYVCFESKIIVYKRKNDFLLTFYIFENKKYKFKPFFDNKIYVKVNGLFLLNEYPEKILEEDVFLCENVAIGSDNKLTIIEECECAPLKCAPLKCAQLKEFDVDERVDALFEIFKYQNTGFYTCKTEDELLLKKEIHEFRTEFLDKLKIIFTELKITNESFEDFVNELKNESIKIEAKINEITSKKRKVLNNLRFITEKLKFINSNQNYSGDFENVKLRIQNIRKNLLAPKNIDQKYILDKLKCQKLILKSLIMNHTGK